MKITGPIGEQKGQYTSISPADITPAQGVDVEALRAADPDPLEVVVSIPASKSKRGWNYTKESLGEIVDYVNQHTLSGFLGHQKAEEVSNEFPTPATHWIGAKMEGEIALIRGIIDASQENLKRWLRTGRIKEVSIFGYPELEKDAQGEINVVGYKPLSIDWTPLHRPGMATEIVAMEMETQRELEEIIRDQLKARTGAHTWIEDFILDPMAIIYRAEDSEKLYKVPYTQDGDTVTLGDAVEVHRVMTYEEVAVKDENKVVETTETQGEMAPAGESMEEKLKEAVGEISIERLAEAVKALEAKEQADHAARVKTLIAAKVAGETAQILVGKLITAEMVDTDEVINGKIDAILEDAELKKALGEMTVEAPAAVGGTETKEAGVKFTSRKF